MNQSRQTSQPSGESSSPCHTSLYRNNLRAIHLSVNFSIFIFSILESHLSLIINLPGPTAISEKTMADDSFDDKVDIAELSLSNRGERSGRGRGRDGRSTGGRPGQGREVEISKALSKLLRHAAVEEGLELDAGGFAKVDQVVGPVSYSHHSFKGYFSGGETGF